ncbi:MAG: glycerol dehydrogenase [Cetobacterium sp.]|uniref:glycerol dehydrogenase n=1 Tax=Cetobacterium sp. TaxID=2071632 RepID=UPI002FCBEE0B
MKIIASPSKYIQGKNIIENFKSIVETFGKNNLIIADSFVTSIVKEPIENSKGSKDTKVSFNLFNGECSKNEINRIVKIVNEHNYDCIVGVGGGKTLDTAKAVSFYTKKPVVIMPTIASTDAPTSALSVIYTDDGAFEEYLMLPKNPDIVMIDTEIVSNAPTRLLVSGVGDALSTYYEAKVCFDAKAIAMSGGQSTLAALALAKLCRDTLLAEAYEAKISSDLKLVNEALEHIIEANTYLSGIGFESSGLAAAHAIHNGLTVLPETHHMFHGEKVAFGTISQLILQNEIEEAKKIITFCKKIGLPTTLEELGIKDNIREKVKEVSIASCAPGETIHNFPYKITPDMVESAILTADALGKL